MMELFLNESLGKISLEIDEASNAIAVLILAHGSGAGMHHPFLSKLAGMFADRKITTVRFNFPYMEAGKKFPGSPKPNIETWKLVAAHVSEIFPGQKIFLSGKSYGGRMASHLMVETELAFVKGLVYFGFPLHAPGKDSVERAAHLPNIQVPQLFLQGVNDKLANIEMMRKVTNELPGATLHEFPHADHSFSVPKASGFTNSEVMESLVQTAANWMQGF